MKNRIDCRLKTRTKCRHELAAVGTNLRGDLVDDHHSQLRAACQAHELCSSRGQLAGALSGIACVGAVMKGDAVQDNQLHLGDVW